jgi:hypothetical protein
MAQTAIPQKNSNTARYLVIGLLVLGAFFASYKLANALNNPGQSASAAGAPAAAQVGQAAVTGAAVTGAVSGGSAASGPAAGGSGGGCCGGGGSAPVAGAATQAGSVQRIAIDTSSGSYNPNVIKLKASVPAELTFSQSSGCLGRVISSDLGFSEDLSGGPKTVKLAALQPGTYSFSCGMQMVYGSVVVQ